MSACPPQSGSMPINLINCSAVVVMADVRLFNASTKSGDSYLEAFDVPQTREGGGRWGKVLGHAVAFFVSMRGRQIDTKCTSLSLPTPHRQHEAVGPEEAEGGPLRLKGLSSHDQPTEHLNKGN